MKSSGPIKRSNPLKRSTKPIRKVNPIAKAKRVAKQRKHYASAEYKAARKEAMERAGKQCEYIMESNVDYSLRRPWVLMEVDEHDWDTGLIRCGETEKLEAHHLRYPKTRALTSDDLEIRCTYHHHLTEMVDHPTRHQW